MEQNTALQVFNFQEQQVRTILIDENPWFVIADACKVLEIANVGNAISRLDEDGIRQADVIDSIGRNHLVAIANEPNLYRLIFRSDKPQAKAFQDWVYNEVLPTIRKTGNYSLDSHQLEERLHRLEQEVAALSQVGQRPRLARTVRKSAPASEEEVRAKVAKRVLVFLQRQEEPVSRRTITKYGHSCIAIIEPILDELVASGQVSRIKVPGSRVQWFYQVSGREDEMSVTGQGQPPAC